MPEGFAFVADDAPLAELVHKYRWMYGSHDVQFEGQGIRTALCDAPPSTVASIGTRNSSYFWHDVTCAQCLKMRSP